MIEVLRVKICFVSNALDITNDVNESARRNLMIDDLKTWEVILSCRFLDFLWKLCKKTSSLFQIYIWMLTSHDAFKNNWRIWSSTSWDETLILSTFDLFMVHSSPSCREEFLRWCCLLQFHVIDDDISWISTLESSAVLTLMCPVFQWGQKTSLFSLF